MLLSLSNGTQLLERPIHHALNGSFPVIAALWSRIKSQAKDARKLSASFNFFLFLSASHSILRCLRKRATSAASRESLPFVRPFFGVEILNVCRYTPCFPNKKKREKKASACIFLQFHLVALLKYSYYIWIYFYFLFVVAGRFPFFLSM